MTKAEYVSRWQDLVDAQAASGMTVSSWCKSNHIQSSYFYSCRSRLRDRQLSCAGFIELKPQAAEIGETGILILLGARPHIEVAHGFDPQILRAVVSALTKGGSGIC